MGRGGMRYDALEGLDQLSVTKKGSGCRLMSLAYVLLGSYLLDSISKIPGNVEKANEISQVSLHK